MNPIKFKNKETRIAVLFFAYNLGKKLKETEDRNKKEILKEVKRAVEKVLSEFKDYGFTFHFVDDGSSDDTRKIIEEFKGEEEKINASISYEILGDEINLGLAEREKYIFGQLLEKNNFEYIIKTDLDGDFDFFKVLNCLLGYVNSSFDNVVATRWVEPNKIKIYEKKRKEEILEIMEDNQEKLNLDSLDVTIKDFDPASAGTQLYRLSALKEIINFPLITNYNKKWGLDFLIPIVASGLKFKIEIKKIRGNYQRDRREFKKIKDQFDTYIEIVASLLNEKPEELSEFYFYNHR